MKKRLVLLVLLLMLLLTGCRRYSGFLPYAREIEDMELIRTLGVDTAGDAGVTITASGGTSQEETQVVSGEAGTISAAVLELQGEGSSYLYFGHVTQLLLGEGLAKRGVMPSLDYVLRDVEMRLETALYVVVRPLRLQPPTALPPTGWRPWLMTPGSLPTPCPGR